MEYYVASQKVGMFCQFSTVQKVLNAELEFNKRDKLLYLVAKYDLGYDVEIFCYNSQPKVWALKKPNRVLSSRRRQPRKLRRLQGFRRPLQKLVKAYSKY